MNLEQRQLLAAALQAHAGPAAALAAGDVYTLRQWVASPDGKAALVAAGLYVVELGHTITERGVLGMLGTVDGEAFLQALDDFCAAPAPQGPLGPHHPAIKRVVGWLKSPAGIDVGEAAAQTLLPTLGALGVVNAAHAARIAQLAWRPLAVSEEDLSVLVPEPEGNAALRRDQSHLQPTQES